MDSLSSISQIAPAEVPATSGVAAPTHLTSGRLLAGNTFWNLVGLGLPMVVGVFCLPVLKRSLGTDRLGLLSLAWVVIGYFGLFDFGLSRALTKVVAERLGQRRYGELQPLISTSLVMLALLGTVGGVATVVLSRWIVEHLLNMPAGLHAESLHAFYWLAVSLPMVIVTAGARGVLEALQRFRLATAIRIPMGIFNYVAPVLVLPLSRSTVTVVAVLVIGRAVGCIAHIWACVLVLPELRRPPVIDMGLTRPLLSFGGWMTVSNVVGPFMVTFDRFVIGAMISVAAVAYYAVPYEVVYKLTMWPAALITVLFPAFSTAGRADRGRLAFLYESGIKYVFIGLFVPTLALIAFAPEALNLWLGRDFAVNSTPVARWLLVAIFLNGLAQVPFAHLQSEGRPDITAKLHLFELPLYACMLFVLGWKFSIQGVALAWLLRVVVDTGLLFMFSHRMLPENKIVVSKLPVLVGAALVVFGIASSGAPFGLRMAVVSAASVLAAVAAWFWMFSPRERKSLQALFRRAGAQAG